MALKLGCTSIVGTNPHLEALQLQLEQWFRGERKHFDLPLVYAGSEFEVEVWRKLGSIPFGETWSYGELARALNRPKAARAVGHANSRNPIAILVPCHRVIGASGELTGYAAGLERKRWLLEHERSVSCAAAANSARFTPNPALARDRSGKLLELR